MIEEKELLKFQAPSKKRIAMAAVAALFIAGALLATVVLPAEYGIDPTGAGAALRLTELAGATPAAAPASPTDAVAIIPTLVPDPNGGAPVVQGAFIGQPKGYRFDSREIKLNPREGMEIKYNMRKGAGLVYSWKATGTLAYEFHGDPDVKPEGREGTDYYETYELDDKTGKDQAHGTFIAPTKGVHGWFWENKSD